MSQSKKEMMNRALSAMTMNIGKAGVNDNVIGMFASKRCN